MYHRPGKPGGNTKNNPPVFLLAKPASGSNNNSIIATSGEKTMNARSLFFFDSMLTPKFITFIYWIGLMESKCAADSRSAATKWWR